MHRLARSLASIVLASLLAAPAGAQPADGSPAGRVEQLAASANAAYDAGDFGRAVSLYLEAYKLEPAAAVLYNVAIIYDKKLGEPDLASTFYRRYIGAPDADPKVVKRATARLAELKAAKAKREALAFTLPTPDEASPGVGARVEPPAEPRGMHPRAVLGWSLAGVGAAALIGGGAMGLVARGTHDDYESATTVADKMALRADGENQALGADILFAAGGVLAISGVVLALTAPDGEASAWRVAPTADAAGASVWFGGSL
jgi:tetratricopeptide (TPR) repeat protein